MFLIPAALYCIFLAFKSFRLKYDSEHSPFPSTTGSVSPHEGEVETHVKKAFKGRYKALKGSKQAPMIGNYIIFLFHKLDHLPSIHLGWRTYHKLFSLYPLDKGTVLTVINSNRHFPVLAACAMGWRVYSQANTGLHFELCNYLSFWMLFNFSDVLLYLFIQTQNKNGRYFMIPIFVH